MLIFDEKDYARLRQHGEESYPQECCGVLVGTVTAGAAGREGERRVRRVVGCRNARAERREQRYEIDPRELVAIQRQARAEGAEIIGFYHSHPDHPAQWSATDLAEAHWIGCAYVITAVQKGKAAESNAFALAGELEENKRFVAEAVEVLAASGAGAEKQEGQWRR